MTHDGIVFQQEASVKFPDSRRQCISPDTTNFHWLRMRLRITSPSHKRAQCTLRSNRTTGLITRLSLHSAVHWRQPERLSGS